MISIDLSGGLVVVTGGAGSIGRAIARQAAQAGASIAVCDTNIEEVEAVAAQIRTNGAVAKSFEMDVTEQVVVKQVMDRAVKELGPLRGLVTAAGVLRTGPLSSQSHEDWQRVMAVNVDGTLHAVQAAIPHLESTHGSIVTLGVSRHSSAQRMEGLTPLPRVPCSASVTRRPENWRQGVSA